VSRAAQGAPRALLVLVATFTLLAPLLEGQMRGPQS
jgi:hypothetical protein